MSAQYDLYFSLKASAQISSNLHNEERNQPCQQLTFEDKVAICDIMTHGGAVGWLDDDGVAQYVCEWEEGMTWKGGEYYRLVWPNGGNMWHPLPLPWLANEAIKSEEEIRFEQERRVAQTGEGSCAQ